MGRIPDGQQIADQNEAFRIAEAMTTDNREGQVREVQIQLRKVCSVISTLGPKNWPVGVLDELKATIVALEGEDTIRAHIERLEGENKLTSALQHPAAPSVSPAGEGGKDIAAMLDDRAQDHGGDKLLTEAANLIRRLATPNPVRAEQRKPEVVDYNYNGDPIYAKTEQPEVRGAWKLVPVEPTPEMLSAAGTMNNYDVDAGGRADDDHIAWWSQMLAAAPAAPGAAVGVDGLRVVAKRNLRSLIERSNDSEKELMLKCLEELS